MKLNSTACDLVLRHIRRLGALARHIDHRDLRTRRAAAIAMDSYRTLAIHYLRSVGEFEMSITALQSEIAREIRAVDKNWHSDCDWIESLARSARPSTAAMR